MKREITRPLLFVVSTLALWVLGVLHTAWSGRWLDDSFAFRGTFAAFLVSLISGAVIVRQVVRGTTRPSLLLLVGVLPVMASALLAVSAFDHASADPTFWKGPENSAANALTEASEVRALGASLSAALLVALGVFTTLRWDGFNRRRLLLGLLFAAPFSTVFFLGVEDAPLLLWIPAIIALVALPIALAQREHFVARGLLLAASLTLAQWCSAIAVECLTVIATFGFHGCGPATLFEIAVGIRDELLPVRWFEVGPWLPGALATLLISTLVRHRARMRLVVSSLLIMGAVVSLDARARRQLTEALDDRAPLPPSRVVKDFAATGRVRDFYSGPPAQLIAGKSVIARLDGLTRVVDPYSLGSADQLTTVFRATARRSERQLDERANGTTGSPAPTLTLIPDARLTGMQLKHLAATARDAGVKTLFFETRDLEGELAPSALVSSWTVRLAAGVTAVPLSLTTPSPNDPQVRIIDGSHVVLQAAGGHEMALDLTNPNWLFDVGDSLAKRNGTSPTVVIDLASAPDTEALTRVLATLHENRLMPTLAAPSL